MIKRLKEKNKPTFIVKAKVPENEKIAF
jgi:hypothetical protein